ncbi:MAG: molybdopterin-dependent oxidoreductase [Armatimonadetes bacterium]|nr:molybdopterin-dependent oxidoreductase [Armatimonadota bacterium]
MEYTVGCDEEGRLVALRARMVGDTGAYASVGDMVLERAAGHGCGAYKVPNVDIEARAVYTNNPPCGAMRGFGSNQSQFALEGMMDILAERVGIDGWEFRWRNALDVGDTFGTGQALGEGVGVKACLEAVREHYYGARYAGISCAVKNTGVGNGLAEYGKAILRPEGDGRVTLLHSWTEMGQGAHTVLAQIAATELGVSFDRIDVKVDTERELQTGQTTASRATVLGGRAIIEAAKELKAALNGGGIDGLAGQEFYGEVVIDYTTKPGKGGPTHFAYGWACQVVILDEDGRIDKVVAAHDVGRVINRTLLEGQIEGGLHMGLGHSLSEELVIEDGIPARTLKSLNIIPAAGMPPVECIFVEVEQPEGPYGAKGLGEGGILPVASAVTNAVYNAVGVRIKEIPLYPERVLKSLSLKND